MTTLVKRGASIGANATIVYAVTLHEAAFVAAGGVVMKDDARLCNGGRSSLENYGLDECLWICVRV